jgi:archaellum component FlaC
MTIEIRKDLELKKFIDNEIDNKLTSQDIQNENFVKFLSDSRDSAFEYIEDVQSTIKEFVDVVEPEMSYFDKYGIVGSAYPHYDSMKKISESYKKLKTVLPEDYGKI